MSYELEQLFREWEADNLNNDYNHFIADGVANYYTLCAIYQQALKERSK